MRMNSHLGFLMLLLAVFFLGSCRANMDDVASPDAVKWVHFDYSD